MTNNKNGNYSLDDLIFPAAYLDLAEKFYARRNYDASAIHQACHISKEQLESREGKISGRQFLELFRCCANIARPGTPLSVQLEEVVPITVPGGMFGLATFTAKNIQQALEVLFDFSPTVMPAYHFELLTIGTQCHITMEPAMDFGDMQHVIDETVVGYILNLRHYADLGKTRPKVHFTHPAFGDIRLYEDIFKAEFLFSQKSIRVIFEKEHLKKPLFTHSEATFQEVYSQLKAQKNSLLAASTTSKVIRILNERLAIGKSTNISHIAEQLHVSERTLARRLRQEGNAFVELKQRVAIECAKHLLECTENPINKVACMCGYNSESNFSRAFKSVTGVTPKQFRAGES